MNPWYTWRPKPELVRAVLVALGAFIIQQPVDTLDRIWSSDQPVKLLIALAIAATQFIAARLLAALPDTRPPGQREVRIGTDAHPATNPPRRFDRAPNPEPDPAAKRAFGDVPSDFRDV